MCSIGHSVRHRGFGAPFACMHRNQLSWLAFEEQSHVHSCILDTESVDQSFYSFMMTMMEVCLLERLL